MYKTITYVSKTGWNLTSSTSFSQSFTVSTNSNRILIAIFCTRNATGSNFQYGGEAMTLAKRNTYDGFNVEIWYKVNPKSGANNLTASLDSGNDRAIIGAIEFFNVDQVNPVNGTFETDIVSSTSVSTTCTAVGRDNCVGVDGFFHGSDTLGSVGGTQVAIKTRDTADNCGCSYEMDIDTSSEAMGWSGWISDEGAHAVVVFNPAPRTGGAFILTML